MSVLEKNNFRLIKYYGAYDLSTNLIIDEFQKNNNFILISTTKFKDYNSLLDKDFILGFWGRNKNHIMIKTKIY